MYSRGKSINPEKQEKLDNMAKQFAAGGKKKWVRYDEGALLYSMGIHSLISMLSHCTSTSSHLCSSANPPTASS